jgi:hypothetical protein
MANALYITRGAVVAAVDHHEGVASAFSIKLQINLGIHF